jgi:hypothetical protein
MHATLPPLLRQTRSRQRPLHPAVAHPGSPALPAASPENGAPSGPSIDPGRAPTPSPPLSPAPA